MLVLPILCVLGLALGRRAGLGGGDVGELETSAPPIESGRTSVEGWSATLPLADGAAVLTARLAPLHVDAARQGFESAALLRRFAMGDGLSPQTAAHARTILLGQQFNAGLPARLPDETPVAHKTGNLPGLLHDAGWIEHPRGRVIVVAFTDRLANDGDGAVALAAIGEAVWDWLGAS